MRITDEHHTYDREQSNHFATDASSNARLPNRPKLILNILLTVIYLLIEHFSVLCFIFRFRISVLIFPLIRAAANGRFLLGARPLGNERRSKMNSLSARCTIVFSAGELRSGPLTLRPSIRCTRRLNRQTPFGSL